MGIPVLPTFLIEGAPLPQGRGDLPGERPTNLDVLFATCYSAYQSDVFLVNL